MTDNVKLSKLTARDPVKYRAAKAKAAALGVALEIVDEPGYVEPPRPVVLVTEQDLRRAALYRLATTKARELGAELMVAESDAEHATTRATLTTAGRQVYGADGVLLP